ncbi:hypothetical protein R1sor_024973 [Riccia sorocarpa]|uniref:Uncharacterized protein n=1 Tax=Riccia sorocarpa TaxID=122646 RepID=A0ABD3GAH6_9MARC
MGGSGATSPYKQTDVSTAPGPQSQSPRLTKGTQPITTQPKLWGQARKLSQPTRTIMPEELEAGKKEAEDEYHRRKAKLDKGDPNAKGVNLNQDGQSQNQGRPAMKPAGPSGNNRASVSNAFAVLEELDQEEDHVEPPANRVTFKCPN